MNKNSITTDSVNQYLQELTRELPVQKKLRLETFKLPMAVMQITPDQGMFLAMLVKISGAKNILEIGTFTGYSSLAMALALPENGRIVALDSSEEWTDVARRYWDEANVKNKINLRIGDAHETLKVIVDEEKEKFDLVFIDADKKGYDFYYENALKLLNPGGLIALDNMLWGGAVAGSSDQTPQTVALRDLNKKIAEDKRVEFCLASIGDGMMIVRKK